MKTRARSLVVIIGLSLFACSTGEVPHTGVLFEDLTIDQAVARAAEQNKLVLIDVFSPT